MRRQLNSQKGFSLMEAMIGVALTSIVALAMMNFTKAPTKIISYMNNSSAEQTGVRALDMVVNDLRQADQTSFPYSAIDPTVAGGFWFRVNNIDANPPFLYVNYQYQAGTPTGSLVRCTNASAPQVSGEVCATILTNVMAPTVPIFQQDATVPTVIDLTLGYQPISLSGPTGQGTVIINRRASIRS